MADRAMPACKECILLWIVALKYGNAGALRTQGSREICTSVAQGRDPVYSQDYFKGICADRKQIGALYKMRFRREI